MSEFVYIIDRDGELDVYASLLDAQEAAEILGGDVEIIEQAVFAESGSDTGSGSTRQWLDSLRAERAAMSTDGADPEPQYKSQAARDAKRTNYGGERYWAYLDESAQRKHDYYVSHGQPDRAEEMLTRSLSEALMGNDGD